MAKTYIIKNFPEELHRDAKIAAVLQDITLRELILRAVQRYVDGLKGASEAPGCCARGRVSCTPAESHQAGCHCGNEQKATGRNASVAGRNASVEGEKGKGEGPTGRKRGTMTWLCVNGEELAD